MIQSTDACDVYDERSVTACVTHRCSACWERIDPGHRYTRVGIVFDGYAWTIKRCLRCQTLHEHLRQIADGDEWPDDQLNCGDSYEDLFGPPPAAIAALAFALPGEDPG